MITPGLEGKTRGGARIKKLASKKKKSQKNLVIPKKSADRDREGTQRRLKPGKNHKAAAKKEAKL